ncbi:hypothetical protein B484DRAFT_477434 [Ochromonadaceae sp. CCMP2298]|nr:hypothetical protein B484DRAFT_477434 [Ochromonadaceae sp. CCMP2298]
MGGGRVTLNNKRSFGGNALHAASIAGGGGGGGEGERERAEAAHALLRCEGDFLTLLNVYQTWRGEGGSQQWCQRHYINYRGMRTVHNTYQALMRDATKILTPNTSTNNNNNTPYAPNTTQKTHKHSLESRISTTFTSGFFMNSATRCNDSVFKYLTLSDIERSYRGEGALDVRMVAIHPTSAFADVRCPEFVIFQEMVHSSKLYIRVVGRADSKLLQRLQRGWRWVSPYVLCGRELIQGAEGTEGGGTGVGEGTGQGLGQKGQGQGQGQSVGSKRSLSSQPEALKVARTSSASVPAAAAAGVGAGVVAGVVAGVGEGVGAAPSAAELARMRYLQRKGK